MRFLTAQLNRKLNLKNHRHEGYAKMHKTSGNLTYKANFRTEWAKSPL